MLITLKVTNPIRELRNRACRLVVSGFYSIEIIYLDVKPYHL